MNELREYLAHAIAEGYELAEAGAKDAPASHYSVGYLDALRHTAMRFFPNDSILWEEPATESPND